SIEIAEHLLEAGAKLLVVACNAASAAALEPLARHLEATRRDVDVIGVVAPATQLAVAGSHTGRLGLLATPATVRSGAYERAIASRGLLNPQPGEGAYRFQCTADVESFKALGTRFLQMPLGDVVHVELAERVPV